MLNAKEKGILVYIIEHCKRVEEKINGETREILDNNKDVEEVICFNILQIGELAKKLSDGFIIRYNKVPWKSIKGMRDKVAHGYDTIDRDQIWKAASEDIVPLREYCEEIINSDNEN